MVLRGRIYGVVTPEPRVVAVRRFIPFRKSSGPEPPLLVHREVRGKALSLLVVLALALGAFHFAQYVPPGLMSARGDVADAREDGGREGVPVEARAANPVEVRGLDYQLPSLARGGVGPASALEMMRDAGLLRGYSLPSRKLAFTPDGGYMILPTSPVLEGPRDVAVIYHGNRAKKRIALTFDTSEVGEPNTARAIIDELTRLRAPATFFVCGAWCYKNPDLLRLAVDRGFEIANHSFGHPAFTAISNEQIAAQLKGTEEAVANVAGSRISAYCRPPYGAIDARVEQVVAQQGYATVLWDVDTNDWRESSIRELIRDRATVGMRGGEIVLMHTTGSHTKEALMEIVGNMRANGFQLTTLTGVMQP
jgi:peptidoglycan/xylan/chitin deacetylase (PgdA/CDA1 family)